MKLFSAETYKNRRNNLKKNIVKGKILFLGNNEAPMNYTDNTFRFRQDSSFLYYFGINLPGLSALIDIDNDQEIIFGHEFSMDDIIWIGPHESLASLAQKVGVEKTISPAEIDKYINKNALHFLPQYRFDNQIFIAELLNQKTNELKPSLELIKAVVSQRSIKTHEEIVEMTKSVNVTREMHVTAMKATAAGKMEYEVVGKILETMHAHNAELSYPVIFSVNGQTLHNHYHGNKMQAGQLAINDSGCETEMGYAGDITRTIPVSGKFSQKQKDIYETVLEMEVSSIESLKPGLMYKDVHLSANKILLTNLKTLGLVTGNIEDMLEEGVGGLFMPHGLGHMIGLDVHDMEALGENYVGYRNGLDRSTQLGLKSLRMAKELEAGHVITVEPGCYFIPELISRYKTEGKFKEFVNYSKVEEYLDFGGIRIEDNVFITETGHQILGEAIPKTREEVEEIMR
ncbi:aminopeptidase P family protein [Lacihabitans sp. CCS-44]|uniref:aminopeptidase P family protein n=1 Tax=Lacihabitans sp. CCS-44 TaxID=2487331 RepID=UPI0020CD2277|nr:aminopeptidase P family protein [Lacihabitans sp. CCS-44]MCP9755135.1 aminopeptidase P family protein [Lacihabitans sp. CCS-44]